MSLQAFIDFQKAFDFVDRDVLLYKLLSNGIDGKIYNSIKSILSDTSSCIKLNGMLMDWFPVLSGVRQGGSSSPSIFAFFINDLIESLKAVNKGIKFNDNVLCCLTYADDVLILAENENDMQNLLNYVYDWCRKWRLIINFSKTSVVHFRNRGKHRSEFEFKIGNQKVEYASVYRYLGVHMNEHLDFVNTADTLSKAGGRALDAAISKIHSYKDVGFKTYSKLFYSCVVPVLDYCSGVWGFKNFDKINMIQNRAIRYFLGVHRFTPILAITGDMGWVSSTHRRWVNMLRLWNRLVSMDITRFTRIVFEYDYRFTGKNWCSDIKTILGQVNLLSSFHDKTPVNLKQVEDRLLEIHKLDWANKIQTLPKLRTYKQFKREYCTEKYVLSTLSKTEKSHLAQFRCGILPLRVETGRYIGLALNERTCQICNSDETEDEMHFLFNCPRYNDLRQIFIAKSVETCEGFLSLSDEQKIKYLLEKHYVFVAKYIVTAMDRRKSYLYN